MTASDYDRAAELMPTYTDLEVGFVDCAVLAATERLGEQSSPPSTIATSARCAPSTLKR